MLSDPTKLRTRAGLGYLVGRRDVFSNLDERAAADLAQRLLAEPGNEAALREALGFGAETDSGALAQWLETALAGGSRVCVRTRRAPPVLDEAETTDLVDLIDPKPGGPREVVTTWMELRVVDEQGAPLAGVAVRVSAGGVHNGTTDDQGVFRVEDAESSFGRAALANTQALQNALRERWTQTGTGAWQDYDGVPHVTVTAPTSPLPDVALQAKTPHTLVFQPRVSRVRIVGAVFDSNKAFVLPDALPLLRDVVSLYADHPEAQMLVLGHTDTSGEPSVNDPLSLQRAEVVVAYLRDDVDAWLAFFEPSVSASQRWGPHEEGLMLEQALWSRGQVPDGDPVRAFQASRGLDVDGDLGPNTRRALVEAYMELDGSTLPSAVEAFAHGCGENFPLADDGTSLDVSPPDGVDDPTDRRVEVLFFDAPLGILPPPAHENSPAQGAEYLTWCSRARFTQDMLVIRPLAVAVRVFEEDSDVVVPDALVSFQGVDMLGNAPSGSTDTFGVRTFINIVAGAYQVDVAKPGYDPGSLTHVVVPGAPASVLVVRLALDRTLNLQVSVVGPNGERIPVPEGLEIRLSPDEGVEAKAETAQGGVVVLRAGATSGRASLELSTADTPCLVRTQDGSVRLASVEDALEAAASGASFIQLPATLTLASDRLQLDTQLPLDEHGAFDLAAALAHSRSGAVGLDIQPAWEHVAFGYFDRHHETLRTVPGPGAEGEPALIMTGHLGGAEDPATRTAWPVEVGTRTVHSVAWFPDAGAALTAEDVVRMQCPPRTFAVSDRKDAKRVRLEVIPSSGDRAKLVDTPNPDRLLFYDVPSLWQGDRYFGRRASEPPSQRHLLPKLLRTTSSKDPILVSLDDIVLMRSDGAGGRQVVDIETQFSILNNRMEVYKANHTVPEGYGEPYFTHKELLRPAPGDGDVPAHVLLDTGDATRAILYRQVHEVFDLRTDTSDVPGPPVGARIAYTPFSSDSVLAAVQDFSPFFRVVGHFQVDGPGRPATEVIRRGRSMMALFRCTGSREATEIATSLQVLRFDFDFSPTGDPPDGGKALISKHAKVAKEFGPVLTAQALHQAAIRWSGPDASGPTKQLINANKGKPVTDPYVADTKRARSFFGPSMEVEHVVVFTRRDHKLPPPEALGPNPFEFTVSLWSDLRSSMSGSGDAEWGYLAAMTSGSARSTTAHELGHALGLPDEYAEVKRHASLGRHTFSDDGVPEGRPYVFDTRTRSNDTNAIPIGTAPNTSGMMTSNESPRPRHFAPLALELAKVGGLPKLTRIEVGPYAFEPPSLGPPNPYFPAARRLSVRSGEHGVFDGFLYLYGNQTALSERFADQNGPVDGQLLIRTRFSFSHSGPFGTTTDYLNQLQALINGSATRIAATLRLSVDHAIVRVRLTWSPRFLLHTLPSAPTPDEADDRTEYLSKLLFYSDGETLHTVTLRDLEQEKSTLSQDLALQWQVQLESKAKIAELESIQTRNVVEEGMLKQNRKSLQKAIAKEKELLAELAELAELEAGGFDPEKELIKDYAAFVSAITADHPPHVVINPVSKWSIKISGGTPTTRTITLPVKGIRLLDRKFAVQRILMRLLGGSGHRARLTATELEGLAREVFADTPAVSVLGVDKQ